MKQQLRALFSPLLNLLEQGDEQYQYKPSHRSILIAVGCLFLFLAGGVAYVGYHGEGYGFVLPLIVFGVVALVSLIVGSLGSDKAVAKLWGSK